MTWSEAFSRAFGGVVALIGIYIAAIVLMAIGGGIIGGGSNTFLRIIGFLFFLAGLALMLLGGLATMIKLLTDSITDSVVARVGSVVRSQANQGQTPVTSSPTSPRATRRSEPRVDKLPNTLPSRSSTPRTRLSLMPNPPYVVRNGGEGVSIEIRNIEGAPWTITRTGSGSSQEDGVVVDKSQGNGDQTIHFSWDQKQRIIRRHPYTFNLMVGEGQDVQTKSIVVMAEP